MLCQLHDIVLCTIELIPLWLHNGRTFSLEDHRLAKPDFRRRKIKFHIRSNQTITSLKMCITSRQERDRNLAARDDSAGPTNKQTILSPSSLRHVRHNLPIFSLSISFVTINIFMLWQLTSKVDWRKFFATHRLGFCFDVYKLRNSRCHWWSRSIIIKQNL